MNMNTETQAKNDANSMAFILLSLEDALKTTTFNLDAHASLNALLFKHLAFREVYISFIKDLCAGPIQLMAQGLYTMQHHADLECTKKPLEGVNAMRLLICKYGPAFKFKGVISRDTVMPIDTALFSLTFPRGILNQFMFFDAQLRGLFKLLENSVQELDLVRFIDSINNDLLKPCWQGYLESYESKLIDSDAFVDVEDANYFHDKYLNFNPDESSVFKDFKGEHNFDTLTMSEYAYMQALRSFTEYKLKPLQQ